MSVILGTHIMLPGRGEGWVRYIGELPGKAGEWAGVELKEKRGRHNGARLRVGPSRLATLTHASACLCAGYLPITSHMGRQLFRCPDMHGVFVPLRSITEILGVSDDHASTPRDPG